MLVILILKEVIRLMNIENKEGYNNISIHLIENYPYNTKDELLLRERYWIDILDPYCNILHPITTNEEKQEYKTSFNEKYREKNKEKIMVYMKDYNKYYRERNKEKLLEYDRYRNKRDFEKRKEMKKKYYENNKERMDEYYKTKILCEYGKYYTIKGKSGHIKTKYHIEYIENKKNNITH